MVMLASLEATLQVGSLVDLAQRFENASFSSLDVIALLGAGLQGGDCLVSPDALGNAAIEGGPMASDPCRIATDVGGCGCVCPAFKRRLGRFDCGLS
jgi:hypothetical protein